MKKLFNLGNGGEMPFFCFLGSLALPLLPCRQWSRLSAAGEGFRRQSQAAPRKSAGPRPADSTVCAPQGSRSAGLRPGNRLVLPAQAGEEGFVVNTRT